jgi:hypothetical protein
MSPDSSAPGNAAPAGRKHPDVQGESAFASGSIVDSLPGLVWTARVAGKRIEITAVRADGKEFPVELALTRILGEGPSGWARLTFCPGRSARSFVERDPQRFAFREKSQ